MAKAKPTRTSDDVKNTKPGSFISCCHVLTCVATPCGAAQDLIHWLSIAPQVAEKTTSQPHQHTLDMAYSHLRYYTSKAALVSANALSFLRYLVSGDRVVSEGQELLQQEEKLQQIVESRALGKWEVLETEMQVQDADDDDDGTRVQERCSSQVSTDLLLLLSRFVVSRFQSQALMFLP